MLTAELYGFLRASLDIPCALLEFLSVQSVLLCLTPKERNSDTREDTEHKKGVERALTETQHPQGEMKFWALLPILKYHQSNSV